MRSASFDGDGNDKDGYSDISRSEYEYTLGRLVAFSVYSSKVGKVSKVLKGASYRKPYSRTPELGKVPYLPTLGYHGSSFHSFLRLVYLMQ